MRRKNRIVLTLALLLMALIGTTLFLLQSPIMLDKVQSRLQNELTAELKKPVSIGGISGNLLFGLKIHRFGVGDLIYANELQIRYKLFGLLQKRFLVTKLRIIAPQFDLKNRNKLTNLFAPRNLETPPETVGRSAIDKPADRHFEFLVSHVELKEGVIKFSDDTRKLKIMVSGVNGRIDGPLDRWSHNGELGLKNGVVELNGFTTKVDQFSTKFRIGSGEGTVRKLQLRIDNSVLTATGDLFGLATNSPSIATKVGLTLDLSDFNKFFPQTKLGGKISVHGTVDSNTDRLRGKVSLAIPKMKFGKLAIEEGNAKANFSKDRLNISDFQAEFGDGNLSGNLQVNFENELSYAGKFLLENGRVEKIQPMLVNLGSVLKTAGKVNGNAVFSGKNVESFLSITEAKLNNVPIGKSEVQLAIDGDELVVAANLDEAKISIDGKIFSDRDLRLQIDAIDVAKLSNILSIPNFDGKGEIDGKITNGGFNGLAKVPNTTLNGVPIGVLTGDFHYANDKVKLFPVQLLKGESRLTLEGIALKESGVPIDFVLHAKPLIIADYIRLTGAERPINGEAVGTLKLSGTLGKLDGIGVLKVENAEAWNLKLDPLSLPIEIKNYDVHVKNFDLSANGQSGILNASIDRKLDYELDFQSKPMQLGKIFEVYDNGQIDLKLASQLTLTAKGKGSVNDAKLELEAKFVDLNYAKNRLPDFSATGILTKDLLAFEGLGFDNSIEIDGTIDLAQEKYYEIAAQSSSFDATPFFPIVSEIFTDRFNGFADGKMQMSGELSDPTSVELAIELPKFSLWNDKQKLFNTEPVKLNYSDREWKINSLSMAETQNSKALFSISNSTASSEARQVGGLQIHARGENCKIETIAKLIDEIPAIYSGIVSYDLTLSGNRSSPKLEVNWVAPELRIEMSQGKIGELQLDRSHGKWVYQADRIALKNTVLQLFGNEVRVWGGIPWSNENPQLPEISRSTSAWRGDRLFLQSNNFNIVNLEGFLPHLSEVSGVATTTAELEGTFTQPIFEAQIELDDCSAKLLEFPTQTISDFSAKLKVNGDKISDRFETQIDEANWRLGTGKFSADGNLNSPLSKLENATFELNLKGNEVELKYGSVDISLLLYGKNPKIADLAGELELENLRLEIAGEKLQELKPIHIYLADRIFTAPMVQLVDQNLSPVLSADGLVNVDGNLNIRLHTTKFPLEVFSTIVGIPKPVHGHFDGKLNIGGNIEEPNFSVEWLATVDRIDNDENLKLRGNLKYLAQNLEVSKTFLSGYGDGQQIGKPPIGKPATRELRFSGNLPIDLSLKKLDLADRLLDMPMALRLVGYYPNMSFLEKLHPQIEGADGKITVDLKLEGTSKNPQFRGDLSLRDCILKPRNLEVPISAEKLHFVAEQGKITVSDFDFQLGKGKFFAKIIAEMNGLIPKILNLEELTIENIPLSGIINAYGYRPKTPPSGGLNFDKLPRVKPNHQLPITNLSGKIAEKIDGEITANATMKIPLHKFITKGSTAWQLEVIQNAEIIDIFKEINGNIEIDELWLKSSDYEIRSTKAIELELSRQKLELDKFELRELSGDLPLSLTGGGFWKLGDTIDFKLKMRNLELGKLAIFLPSEFPLSGGVNAELIVGGTDENPEFDFKWHAPKKYLPVFAKTKIDKFEGKISYRNGILKLGETKNPIRLSAGSNYLVASGIVPFDLSLLHHRAGLLPKPIEGRIDISASELDFMPLIFPNFSFMSGNGSCNITVGGEIGAVKLQGLIGFEELSFGIPSAQLQFDRAKGELDFTHEGLTIRELQGQLNGGKLKIDGEISSQWLQPKAVNLRANLEEGAIFEYPDYYSLLCNKADLSMVGEVISGENLELPPLRGSINLTSGRYEQHWKELVRQWIDKESEIQFQVLSDYPIVRNLKLDLDVVAPNELWLVSDLGKLELEVSMNGKITGAIQKPVFDGRVELLQGEFSFFALDYPFTVLDGSYVENNDTLNFNPRYEIYAETTNPIRGVKLVTVNGEARTKDLTVKAHLSGYLNETHNPELSIEVLQREVGDDFQLTQTQILSLLTLGGVDFQGSGNESNLTSGLFLRQSQRYLGNRFAKMIGFRETRFDINPEGFGESRFLFTKEISNRLALTYSSKFQLNADPRIELEYQLNRRMAIKGERTEEGQYGIDLKLEQKF